MQLDTVTLQILTAVILLMVSLSMPILMGKGVSRAARCMQASLLAEMLTWVLLISSSWLFDRVFSSLAIACGAISQWLMYLAVQGWVGKRQFGRLNLALMVLGPLGYAIGFSDYAFRVGWANFMVAGQMLIVAWATLYPRNQAQRGWRWLLGFALLMLALATLARGIVGGFFPDQYPSFRSPHPINLAWLIAVNVTVVLGTVAMMVAWREEVEQTLRDLAMKDPLTGLLNRRGFFDLGEAALARARRHSVPWVLMMLDLDHFKRVNDNHGHEVGDRALALFARLMAENQRAGDLAGRIGGEEFGVLLSHANPAAAIAFDERLRERLLTTSKAELGFELNFSAGLVQALADPENLQSVLQRADTALYRAKGAGRGQMVQG
ncbi:MAG: GGDEF domain-containing protein [Betaproteobacteria bacterium]|jgi:diguanylate cyclase (GGDEF)-like protein|nr:GGDEF domain-containing protein [Betaproteobacteria bacterium]MBP6646429.1 GGDEF domain-containing protein [Burkholderiaceae bacterium]